VWARTVGTVDIGGQLDAVAHGHPDVWLFFDLEFRSRQEGIGDLGLTQRLVALADEGRRLGGDVGQIDLAVGVGPQSDVDRRHGQVIAGQLQILAGHAALDGVLALQSGVHQGDRDDHHLQGLLAAFFLVVGAHAQAHQGRREIFEEDGSRLEVQVLRLLVQGPLHLAPRAFEVELAGTRDAFDLGPVSILVGGDGDVPRQFLPGELEHALVLEGAVFLPGERDPHEDLFVHVQVEHPGIAETGQLGRQHLRGFGIGFLRLLRPRACSGRYPRRHA